MSSLKTYWLVILILVLAISVASTQLFTVVIKQQVQNSNVQGIVTTVNAQTARSQGAEDIGIDPEEPYLPDQTDLVHAVEFVQNLMSFGDKEQQLQEDPNETTNDEGNQTTTDDEGDNNPLIEDTDLARIFNEVAAKVGVPAKLMKGVMSIECGSLLQLSDELVSQYAAPGQGIPANHKCYRNGVGAMGPMQFMPKTWPSYARAVNTFGGYTHTPNVENIRDSVYASARMYYLNSGKNEAARPQSGQTWTYDQVLRAVICYNAGCGRLSRPFSQLPRETQNYFTKLWSYYTSK